MNNPASNSIYYAVQIKGLTKSFNNHLALKEIDLEVKQGESVVIFGPNGAGKTTLIKILATIMKPSSGEIMINGLNIKKNIIQIQRTIGVVTHQIFLYSSLTAAENLEFYCRMYNIPERQKRIAEVADMMGIASSLHDRVRTLSRGMQQRLSIARSLLHRPSIMMLDEPEAGLDRQAISMLWKSLKTDNDIQRTIILTSHNLERGLKLGDRLLFLDRGKITYQGYCRDLDTAGLEAIYRQSIETQI